MAVRQLERILCSCVDCLLMLSRAVLQLIRILLERRALVPLQPGLSNEWWWDDKRSRRNRRLEKNARRLEGHPKRPRRETLNPARNEMGVAVIVGGVIACPCSPRMAIAYGPFGEAISGEKDPPWQVGIQLLPIAAWRHTGSSCHARLSDRLCNSRRSVSMA